MIEREGLSTTVCHSEQGEESNQYYNIKYYKVAYYVSRKVLLGLAVYNLGV